MLIAILDITLKRQPESPHFKHDLRGYAYISLRQSLFSEDMLNFKTIGYSLSHGGSYIHYHKSQSLSVLLLNGTSICGASAFEEHVGVIVVKDENQMI